MVAVAESFENKVSLMLRVEKKLGRNELRALAQCFPEGIVDDQYECISLSDLTCASISGMEWPVKIIGPKNKLLESEMKIDPRASGIRSVTLNFDGAEVDYLHLPASLTLTPWVKDGEWKLDRTDTLISFREIRKVVRDFGKIIMLEQGCPMKGNQPKLQELYAMVGCKGRNGRNWETSQNVMVVGE